MKQVDRLILFSSKLLEYHRNVLYNKLTGKREPEKIDPEYALEIMENFKVNVRPQVTKVTYRTVEEIKNKEEEEDNKEVPQEEKTKEKSDCVIQ